MTSHDNVFNALHDFLSACTSSGDSDTVDRFVDLELSLSQVKALFVLGHADEAMAINALAERIRLSFAAAGRIVDGLVTSGLVERRENPEDRRVKLVTITAAGREVTASEIDAKQAAMRAQIQRLTPDEAARLAESLRPLTSSTRTEQEIPA
ncbi:MarR family winged helix-turn-helix transcriptional regulator [Aeromicrobium sp. CF3.5]|uniref:MarR family winged helix-turn-helix transcriptional regulator n=1 Tax=Aeromicrobium sp. CF3.5 TaxID=3373078 RepID=UPI003EE5F6CA